MYSISGGTARRCRARRALALGVVLAASVAGTAGAAESPPIWGTAERLDFIERSLDEHRDAVSLWQTGWSVIYGSATVGYLGLALDSDDSDDRALHLVGALRAASAYALLQHRPHPGRRGADPIREHEFGNDEARLAAAERRFAASARRAASVRRPMRHLRNIALNAAFGGLVWALGDSDDVIPFTLMGIAGGEAVLLTLPQGSWSDYETYRSRSSSTASRPWRLVAKPGGIGIEVPLPN